MFGVKEKQANPLKQLEELSWRNGYLSAQSDLLKFLISREDILRALGKELGTDVKNFLAQMPPERGEKK